MHLGDHCLIVALGIAADGQKHALGLWDGSTENATVCQGLLANLQSRGLRTDRSVLVILDGSQALRKAVRATFGDAPNVEVLVIDDGSSDGTADAVTSHIRGWSQARLVRLPWNQGKGAAIKAGVAAARGERIVFIRTLVKGRETEPREGGRAIERVATGQYL